MIPVLPLLTLLAAAQAPPDCSHLGPSDAPAALANDNRTPAGALEGGVLTLRLVAQPVTWYPEGERGCGVPLYAFAEEGKQAQIPGPLLRVPLGTEVRVTVRNALPVPFAMRGLQTARQSTRDSIRSVVIAPESTQTITFHASGAGSFYYWGIGPAVTAPTPAAQIFSQLVGAYVVDPVDGRGTTSDRVLVMTRWRGNPGPAGDLVRRERWEVTAFNGRSWPHTERITATVGDTLHLRVIAANNDGHAMHLHGFYFTVLGKGSPLIDSTFAPAEQRLAVTEPMGPGQSLFLRWIPERAGNWIFHCHLMRHMGPMQRLAMMPRLEGPPPAHPSPTSHAEHDMAGLVLGITVQPRTVTAAAETRARRTLHLFANQRDSVFGGAPGYGFVLQEGRRPPAADSVRLPGSTLVLTRGEPVQIVVHNRLRRPLSVHWHGIELESWSDGVAGWSGAPGRIAPPIAPGESFVARMTPPRAGTFIYHVHNESGHELVAGLYGGLVVVEPGAPREPERDHLFVVAEAGPNPGVQPFVNGTVTPPERELVAGRTARIRIVAISANTFYSVRFVRDTVVQEWKQVAVDGADLPAGQARMVRARALGPGTTRDFEVTPEADGSYELRIDAFTLGGVPVNRPVVVRFRVRRP